MMKRTVAAAIALLGLNGLALAQVSPGNPASTQTIPEKDPSAGGKKPPLSVKGGADLSSKLSKSNGVITPPDPDPNMRTHTAPNPRPNSTPVIPPPTARPGSPVKAK